MTIQREARYLSGNDIGKTITATCSVEGRTVTGVLDWIAHDGLEATLTVRGAGANIYARGNDLVAITGIRKGETNA